MPNADSFPRQNARTRRFTLGQPRTVTVSPDGERVLFLRSPSGEDPRTALWVYDVAAGAERLLADPPQLTSDDADLPAQERARRERLRETAGGIVSYATDLAASVAAFSLSGRLWVVDVATGQARPLDEEPGVVDPRPDPTGRWVAYVRDGGLWRVPVGGGRPSVVADDPDPAVTWGLAEFVAAEEMGRARGFWWAPEGERIVAARVDDNPVATWWIADPAHPEKAPQRVRYPAAGTANADVGLAVLDPDGGRVDVAWDRSAFPYVVDVSWAPGMPPLLTVQSRDQRRLWVCTFDPDSGTTTVVRDMTDERWVEIVPGAPRWLDERLVTVEADGGAYRLVVDGRPVTSPDLQVRSVIHAGDGQVWFTYSDEPTRIRIGRWVEGCEGLHSYGGGRGVSGAAVGGRTHVVWSASWDRTGTEHAVVQEGGTVGGLRSYAATPVVSPSSRLLTLGSRDLRAGLVLPSGHQPGTKLPVLMAPYGGPHAQRVLDAPSAWLEAQWLADQGFAVVAIDGRGTPGRGPEWDRAVHRDLARPVLEDQVDGLHALAEQEPDLDLSRVGIRGWSFGGYLSALAVLRRPDVFHAAVAGAPVTDWRLYDTHYTERYLGDPQTDPAPYDATSLLTEAHRLQRPLMIIHGMADDNVVVAHSLQLSQRLMEHGRPHTVLPLSGVTHMTPQEEVAENLLLLQVEFLQRALG